MNVAFPALLIFALVLPGSVCRYSYARGPWGWANPTSMRTISDELAYSVVIAIGLHALWLTIIGWFGLGVDGRSLLAFLTGNFGRDSEYYPAAIASVTEHKGAIFWYFFSLYGGSAGLGWLGHYLVRRFNLDHKAPLFRFENPWFYLLSGEVLAVRKDIESTELPDGVYASMLAEIGKESFLYWGIVEDFAFDNEGALDRIVLSMAHRRPLAKDRPNAPTASDPRSETLDPSQDDRFYEIIGDFLVVRYEHIRTLNLDYFWIEEVIEESLADSEVTSGMIDPSRN